jgi:hypothetical protein
VDSVDGSLEEKLSQTLIVLLMININGHSFIARNLVTNEK